ncbi:sugar kinase [Hyphomicrobium sp. CS1BSMeth3]|uniref:sugar kinase n=1 Tax=Hyphomicrobium sp. CS1BSMeth3 TaxID=1892844 RepID=UPI00092FF9D9|nr:sugar kinase [Hyphomicrobium sp. CS1BSMeth3]
MNGARKPEILAIGEPMVEFNQSGGHGSRAYLQGFGGDTSNFAIAAARQGADSAYFTRLGDDIYGQMLRDLWAREGVDASTVVSDPDAFTGIYFVTHGKNGHEFSFYRTGSAASRMQPSQLPLELLRGARVLHLSGISFAISATAADTCYAAIEAAQAAGVMVSFDTNLRLRLWSKDRARGVMTDVIGLADICLPSYDDIVVITGLTDPNALVDFCLERGARIVALKLGAEGAIVADKDQRIRLAPHPCDPVDATGAGDAFGGAFVARLLAGDDLATAGRYATVAAALSTEGYGAVEPIPTAAEVRRALEGEQQ